MKKVLIIAFYWGTRIPGLMKYLPEFGWESVLVTPGTLSGIHPPPGMNIIKTPHRDALGLLGRLLGINSRRDAGEQIRNRLGRPSGKSPVNFLLNTGAQIINYPCPDKNWKPFALEAGNKLLEKEGIDAIISSSSPVISHLIAKELKVKYKIPWIADLRDLWSQNHNYTYSNFRRMLDRRLERNTFSAADALVTVSGPWADKLSALHDNRQVFTITNGFDPELVNNPPAELTEKFTITYTGAIYRDKQSPVKFLTALKYLLDSRVFSPDNVEVRFYGTYLDWLEKEIHENGLSEVVKQYGTVDNATALRKQWESQLLLLFDWDDPQEKGVYTLKVFEYFGAFRPVLAIGGSKGDVITHLLNETRAGIHAPSVDDIVNTLTDLFGQYQLKGKLGYNGLADEINKYTHKEMARKFSDILGQLYK